MNIVSDAVSTEVFAVLVERMQADAPNAAVSMQQIFCALQELRIPLQSQLVRGDWLMHMFRSDQLQSETGKLRLRKAVSQIPVGLMTMSREQLRAVGERVQAMDNKMVEICTALLDLVRADLTNNEDRNFALVSLALSSLVQIGTTQTKIERIASLGQSPADLIDSLDAQVEQLFVTVQQRRPEASDGNARRSLFNSALDQSDFQIDSAPQDELALGEVDKILQRVIAGRAKPASGNRTKQEIVEHMDSLSMLWQPSNGKTRKSAANGGPAGALVERAYEMGERAYEMGDRAYEMARAYFGPARDRWTRERAYEMARAYFYLIATRVSQHRGFQMKVLEYSIRAASLLASTASAFPPIKDLQIPSVDVYELYTYLAAVTAEYIGLPVLDNAMEHTASLAGAFYNAVDDAGSAFADTFESPSTESLALLLIGTMAAATPVALFARKQQAPRPKITAPNRRVNTARLR